MTHSSAVAAGLLAAALLPSVALAQKPPKAPKPTNGVAALTLDAKPNPVVFSRPVVLSGKLNGVTPTNGVTVRLEKDETKPFGDSYKPSGMTAATAKGGGYSFTVKPERNTQYRVVAQASPPVTSAPRLVLVRPLIGLRVSTQAPRAGSLVRFSGRVQPARNGASALVQRRGSTGRFVTVGRATLRASSPGSTYSVRVRVRSSGAYRVKLAENAELTNGFSRTVTLTTR